MKVHTSSSASEASLWSFGGMFRGHVSRSYSLSDDVAIVACVDLEAAVVGPEVDRNSDTGYAALVYLSRISVSTGEANMSPRLTISAASVPAIANSRSAYFFQYPKKSGNFARKRS